MRVQTREDVTKSYLQTLVKKILTILNNSEEVNHSNFIEHILGKDEYKKELIHFIHANEHLLETLSDSDDNNTLFKIYYSLLNDVYIIYDNHHIYPQLKADLETILIEELQAIDEAKWEFVTDNKTSIKRAINSLSDAILYDSKAHYDFCKQWHVVSDSLASFPEWQKLVTMVLGDQSELAKGNYCKVVMDLMSDYGITHPGYADSDNGAFNQLIYGEVPVITASNAKKISKPTTELIDELDIWTLDNIVKLFTMYMHDRIYNQDDVDIENEKKNINHHIIGPLSREFINKIKRDNHRSTYSDYDINHAQTEFSEAIDKLILDKAKHDNNSLVNTCLATIAEQGGSKPVNLNQTINKEKSDNIKLPNHNQPKKAFNWELFGFIMAGVVLGSIAMTSIFLTMGGIAAPFTFGGIALAVLHINASHALTTFVGGSILAGMPCIGAIIGGVSELIIHGKKWCNGMKIKKTMTNPLYGDKALDIVHGANSANIQAKLSTNASLPKPIKSTRQITTQQRQPSASHAISMQYNAGQGKLFNKSQQVEIKANSAPANRTYYYH